MQDHVHVNGHEQPYDYLEIREGVSILPFHNGNILLQRQYRYPVRSWQWELPQREPGEVIRLTEMSEGAFRKLVAEGEFMHGAGLAAWARYLSNLD